MKNKFAFKTKFRAAGVVLVAITVALAVSCGGFLPGGDDDDGYPDDPPEKEISTDINGVVINGILWATRNLEDVGVFAESPEIYGKHFQWNRKKAWDRTPESISDWDGSQAQGTKWAKENDPCPTGWRIPTIDELIALHYANADVGPRRNTTYKGVKGTKYIDYATGNTLFLPYASVRYTLIWVEGSREWYEGVLDQHEVGISGYYWSSTPYEKNNREAYSIGCDAWGHGVSYRDNAFSIRCVKE